ncbi:MAG TPA: hypothetical protein VHB47_22625 [Thermoanaerobaculia bacterium]|jgi:hypothetical protein|nr:hypothetical protein [Thermoanaerobaculia bacterium]
MRLLTRSVSSVLLLLVAVSAEAQFTQYTTPGGPEGRPADRKTELAKQVAAARVKLGPVRVAPEVSLKNVEYVKNLVGSAVSTTPSDVTATASGGFRAYLPTGSSVTWTGFALPEYVWWQKEPGRRQLGGLYAVGVDAFWNRLTVAARAASAAQQQVLSAEVPTLVSGRTDQVEVSADLRLTGAISAYASGQLVRQHALGNAVTDPIVPLFAELDREERVERAELRWRPGTWLIGLGAEHSDVTFADRQPGSVNRSNSGTAPVLEVSRLHGRLGFDVDLAQRSLTATRGSAFVKFDKTTGHATVSYEIARPVELFVYASRNLAYSVDPGYSYFDDLRHGASLHLSIGGRARLNVFGETGTLGYTAYLPGTPERHDDLVSFGGSFTVDVLRGVVVGLQGSRTRYNSNIPGAGRTLTLLGFTATLAAGRPIGAVGP